MVFVGGAMILSGGMALHGLALHGSEIAKLGLLGLSQIFCLALPRNTRLADMH